MTNVPDPSPADVARRLPGEIDVAYTALLGEVKDEVRRAQVAAARKVNSELVRMYLAIGRLILARQADEGWGTQVINRLAMDLKAEFGTGRGFSPRTLRYCRTAARVYDDAVGQQLVAQLPWGHVTVLLDTVPDHELRLWYTAKAVEHGWSRNVLSHHISTRLHARSPGSPAPPRTPVSAPDSDLVLGLVKDPYRLDFLALDEGYTERQLEDAIASRITAFLTELGPGFAFVGRQVLLHVGDTDFYLDLLLYHLVLRRYVVIELKTGPATPEAIGKLGFYLAVVDDQHRNTDYGDGPTIGILLTGSRNDIVVEYALRGVTGPMAAVTYQALPDDVRDQLPSPDALSQGLRRLTTPPTPSPDA